MNKQFYAFIVRWLFNSLGLWVAIRLLGSEYDPNLTNGIVGVLFAGLMFSLVNAVLKPVFVILSLPAILLTLGLFMLVVNGLMVYLSLMLTPGISMSFFNSIITGMILSLINYIVSATLIVQSNRIK